MNLDEMIDRAVCDAQVIFGEGKDSDNARSMPSKKTRRSHFRPWTAEEDDFYHRNAGKLSYDEISAALGRSRNAIKVRFTRMGLPAATKALGWMTAQKVSELLSIDPHKTVAWIRKGILPGEQMFFTARPIHRIAIVTLKRWLVRPESWIYFDAGKIKNPALRSLVRRAQERWGDEWWTTCQAADYLGVDQKDVLRQIQIGRICGIQAVHKGGRDQAGWSFWYVRRSEAVQLKIPIGKGGNKRNYPWPAGADSFLIRARAQGLEWGVIARMMKWPQKRCEYRYNLLRKEGKAGNK